MCASPIHAVAMASVQTSSATSPAHVSMDTRGCIVRPVRSPYSGHKSLLSHIQQYHINAPSISAIKSTRNGEV